MKQPLPTPGKRNVFAALRWTLAEREHEGVATYGRTLETENGRDFLQDALEEACDLALYLQGAILERNAARGSHDKPAT